jgi:RHS repeat-associated protein
MQLRSGLAFLLAAACSLTNRSRAGGCAGSHYPFLTSKERDIETGLDYFLARYYSSPQARFTSPDEFSGGPDALYSFASSASSNPTFYADLTNPQSLNKYHYALGNPLVYVDPDGHAPCCLRDEDIKTVAEGGKDVGKGLLKTAANTWLGMNNSMAAFNALGAEPVEPYQPTNTTQAVTMVIAERVTFFAGFLTGRANVGGVAIAEAKTTVGVASAVGSTQAARQIGQQGEALSGVVRNTERIPSLTGTAAYRTPDGLNRVARTIDEVKNVGYQARTNQIRDNIAFAQQQGFTFNLHIRSTTRLSGPLQREVVAGTVNLKTFNPTGFKF